MKRLLFIILIFAMFFAIGSRFEMPQEISVVQQDSPVIYKQVESSLEMSTFPSDRVTVYGIGVFKDSNEGKLVPIDIGLADGEGHTYIDVQANVFGKTFQDSLRIIRIVLEEETGIDLSNKDIYLQLKAPGLSVDGESGSVAIALGLYSILEDKTLKNSTVATGTLLKNGAVSEVESLDAKLHVLENLNINTFLYPRQQNLNKPENYKINTIPINTFKEAIQHSF